MPRTVISRLLGPALLLALLLCLTAGAAAVPRYPERGGVVSDYADILSPQTVADLKELQAELKNESGVGLWVTTVHFLDGEEVSAYARELHLRWELGEEDLLLLLSAGEESYATAAGAALLRLFPEDSQQHLLTAYLRNPFLERRYDQALAQYMPALVNLLNKQYGARVSTAGRFGLPAAAPTPLPTLAPSGNIWQDYLWSGYDSFFRREAEDIPREEAPSDAFVREEETSGMSPGKVLVLVLLFFLIFGSRRRRPGERAGCMGCGCGPLGWIAAALGAGRLFQRYRR